METDFSSYPKIVQRFVEYCKIETTSKDDMEGIATPSTPCQLDLARLLTKQLKELVAPLPRATVELNESTGVILCFVPGTEGLEASKSIVLISHMDTSPDAPAKDVKPQVVTLPKENVKDIVLKEGTTISAKALAPYAGQEIITTDGTTLLGADDKSGLAGIMDALERLLEGDKKGYPRPNLVICFTPDEEVGRGTENVDVSRLLAPFEEKGMNARCGYTVDGSTVGQLEMENFNAYSAVVTINGVSSHPGEAGGMMVNSLLIAGEILCALPQDKRPDTAKGLRDGFWHPISVEGGCGKTVIKFILRAFDMKEMTELQDIITKTTKEIVGKHDRASCEIKITESYRNMAEKMDMEVVEIAKEAYKAAGVEPWINPIRGGTDGCRLTFSGLPTPNIFAGGLNFHSKSEFLPIPSLIKVSDVLVELVRVWASKSKN